ncbi:MAG: Fur family transcriptional regulator [Thiotrichales bacterium]
MNIEQEISSARHKVIQRLAANGISPTRQRIEIGLCLFDADKHVTADQLLELVNARFGDVSKATIYNTLGLFARKGLVREVVVDSYCQVYDTNTSAHHHLYNLDTEELKDIALESVQVLGLRDLQQEYLLEGVDVVIRVRNRA